MRAKGMKRIETVSTPESYFDPVNQHRMKLKRQHDDHRWVFELLTGIARGEEIFIDTDDWMLCRDRHPGTEHRFLVVFRDTSLYTIRDLNGSHLPMLMQIQEACRYFLSTRYEDSRRANGGWRLYFNYMPSVLQLHLHVSRTTPHYSSRVQPLCCVVRNLRANPNHYRECLMLTGYMTRQYDSRGEGCTGAEAHPTDSSDSKNKTRSACEWHTPVGPCRYTRCRNPTPQRRRVTSIINQHDRASVYKDNT